MKKWMTGCFLLTLFLQSAAAALQEDFYFQEVTTQAWQQRGRAQKSQLEDPFKVKQYYKEGVRFQEADKVNKAIAAFKRALHYGPVYPQAAEILCALGECYEKKSQWVEAFKVYQKLAKKYPGFKQGEDIMMRQWHAAQMLADSHVKWVMKEATDCLRTEIAVDLFKELQGQVPHTELAGQCQYEIGKIYKETKQFQLASEAFYVLVINYPRHPLLKEALFESGFCAQLNVRGAEYDSKLLDDVVSRMDWFCAAYAEDPRAVQAKRISTEIKAVKAEKLFQTGRFYEKSKKTEAAKIYYQELIKNYPESLWARRLKMNHLGE